MDTQLSATEAARRLGTTVPRVKRAVDRLDLPVERAAGGRIKIDASAFARLRDELGSGEDAPGLTHTQTAVLAALARAPFGLVSVRAVAARAGVSPTAASRAIEQLVEHGLVDRTSARIAAGRARDVKLLQPRRTNRRWRSLAPALAGVRPPRRAVAAADVVPVRLRHLFWNTAPEQLRIDSAGDSIARRLIQIADPEGLAWGAANLAPANWEHAARTRGLDPRARSLARNLAAAAA